MDENKIKDSAIADDDYDVELILEEIGGTFGKFQIYNYLLLSYAMFVSGQFAMDYVFSTLPIDHRFVYFFAFYLST